MLSTAKEVSAKIKEGKVGTWAVGGGAYLQIRQVRQRPTSCWVVRYQQHGKGRWMGLGSTELISLAEAREKAREARRLLLEGVDPLTTKRAKHRQAKLQEARAVTFKDCAERYIKSHAAGWKNPKHKAQWSAMLETYAYPHFGEIAVADVDVGMVLQSLEPIWSTKPETASRVRGRIEAILDWAKARGYRDGENPARWRAHLDKLLPARRKVRQVEPHAALPYREVPAFMAGLRQREGMAARALELAILTAARTGEVIGAQWSEMNLEEKVWTVPADRMKGRREHRVPLSDRALEILASLPREAGGAFVFPGQREGRPLSNMALLMMLRRMKRDDLTAHGFRSSFRDWCAELTSYPNEVCEMALAHVVASSTEAAYRRGDMFEKRRRLMADWAKFCEGVALAGDVVPMRAKAV